MALNEATLKKNAPIIILAGGGVVALFAIMGRSKKASDPWSTAPLAPGTALSNGGPAFPDTPPAPSVSPGAPPVTPVVPPGPVPSTDPPQPIIQDNGGAGFLPPPRGHLLPPGGGGPQHQMGHLPVPWAYSASPAFGADPSPYFYTGGGVGGPGPDYHHGNPIPIFRHYTWRQYVPRSFGGPTYVPPAYHYGRHAHDYYRGWRESGGPPAPPTGGVGGPGGGALLLPALGARHRMRLWG